MKKKKQSCAANRHKCRPVFLIEQELREAMNDAASCHRNRNYARHQQAMQRIARLKKELEDSRIDQQFHDDNRNMDRAERAFFGKILHLSLNEADLAIYHIEMFFAYFSDRGFKPVPEWEHRKGELIRAIKAYREFVRVFFEGADLRVGNELNFMKLLDLISDRCFTDRERVYYDKYEIKAANKMEDGV